MEIFDLEEIGLISIIPLILFIYGIYLFSLNNGFSDLAGIIIMIISVISFIFSLLIHFLMKKYSWYNKKWYYYILSGLFAVIIVFVIFIIYTRLNL